MQTDFFMFPRQLPVHNIAGASERPNLTRVRPGAVQMACHLEDPPAPVLGGVEMWNWPVRGHWRSQVVTLLGQFYPGTYQGKVPEFSTYPPWKANTTHLQCMQC